MSDDVKSAIEENARDGIKSATGDSGSVTKHSLADQIAADRYLASKAAARNPWGSVGIRSTTQGDTL